MNYKSIALEKYRLRNNSSAKTKANSPNKKATKITQPKFYQVFWIKNNLPREQARKRRSPMKLKNQTTLAPNNRYKLIET